MFRLQSFVLFLSFALLLPYRGHYSALPVMARESSSSKSNFVNLSIDQIKFLGQTGDVFGQGEFRLIILAADTNGKSSGMFCPGNGPLKVKKGDTVKSPCLLAPSFDESKVSDGVYLTIMAVDEDKSSLPADLAYDVVSDELGKSFGKAVTKGLVKTGMLAAKSTPYTFAAEVLFNLATGQVKKWIEKADIIGSQGLYLSRKDNWSATGEPKTVTSGDGGIRLTYTIVRTASSTPGGTVLGGLPVPKKTATPRPVQTSVRTAQISCDEGIIEVNLRKSPGYKNKDDTLDRVVKVPCGETVEILEGPQSKDGLQWWRVAWHGYKGWMADHTGKGRLILIF